MNILEILYSLLYVFLITAIPVLTYYITKYLNSKFENIKKNTEDSVFNDTITEVTNLIIAVVNSTSQTYVDNLKSQGKFDVSSQKQAFNITKDRVLELLSTESKEIIQTIYGDVDKWLDTQIESIVRYYNK